MKKELVIVLVVIIVIVAVIVYLNSNKTEDVLPILKCEQDSDCVRVKELCCDCNSGGTATVINKDYLDYWNKEKAKECGVTVCATVISDHPSCDKDTACIKGKCMLV